MLQVKRVAAAQKLGGASEGFTSNEQCPLTPDTRPVPGNPAPLPAAVTATGVIWSRYSTQITPVNYNLLAVNFFRAITGGYQLSRKLRHDYGGEKVVAA